MTNIRRFICFLICIGMLTTLFAGCGEGQNSTNHTTEPQAEEIVTCIVVVQNEAGTCLSNIMVEVYSDATKTNIVQAKKTDANGVISFNHKGSADGLVAVIKGAPVGYQVEDSYNLEGRNYIISLKTGALLTDEMMDNAKLSLGDAMPDFAVTTSDGRELTLSEMLAQYKTVVLNFWYMGCTPCKMEFPYLQEAYEYFQDDVAVVAMNPVDSTAGEIESFRQSNGYTFSMGKCDSRWGGLMNISAYPVTMVVDRFGNIVMIHNGSVDNAQTFMDIFGYFSADDYLQSFIRSHSQLPTYEP